MKKLVFALALASMFSPLAHADGGSTLACTSSNPQATPMNVTINGDKAAVQIVADASAGVNIDAQGDAVLANAQVLESIQSNCSAVNGSVSPKSLNEKATFVNINSPDMGLGGASILVNGLDSSLIISGPAGSYCISYECK